MLYEFRKQIEKSEKILQKYLHQTNIIENAPIHFKTKGSNEMYNNSIATSNIKHEHPIDIPYLYSYEKYLPNTYETVNICDQQPAQKLLHHEDAYFLENELINRVILDDIIVTGK